MTVDRMLFLVFALVTCGSAIGVVLAQSVVRMAFWLVLSLGSTAALFFLLHADFLGSAQLLIYVGGTVVVLVFGVMLTASGSLPALRASAPELAFSLLVGGALLFLLGTTVSAIPWVQLTDKQAPSPVLQDAARLSELEAIAAASAALGDSGGIERHDQAEQAEQQQGRSVRPLGWALLGIRPDAELHAPSTAPRAAGYLLPFEIISLHLLAVLLGAAYLARTKRPAPTSQDQYPAVRSS